MKHLFISALLLLGFQAQAQNYFQQEVHYNINVTLDDEAHTLDGDIIFDYHNHSSDELPFIWVHLWPNAYKNNQTAMAKQNLENGDADFHYAEEKDRGYINGLNFQVDGNSVKMEYHPEHIDICKIILDEPLKPGKAIRISSPFFVKLPSARFSRLGHVGQSYMITQWYPKPAVYDKNGWHEMPYLSQGEFYSEFGSFDVSITVPNNYTIGATGDLQNKGEINRLETLAAATDTIKSFGGDMNFPPSDSHTKTLQYLQKDVHDFAWFADKRFHVLKGEVELPHSKEKVTTWAMFTNNEAHLWKNSIEYLNDAVHYYSLWNGDYPYKHCTAVDGTIAAGGGMEYPNITVIGESGNKNALETVIVHEVGHNWFYGILGSNERQHPWMDEGINSFNESRYMHTKYNQDTVKMNLQVMGIDFTKMLGVSNLKYKDIHHELFYRILAAMGKDQPIELKSEAFTDMNYGGIVYGKTSVVFDYLRQYVGDERFDNAMRSYYEQWKFKHPQPADLKAVLETELGEDLSWFFDGLIESQELIDYSICSHKHGKLKLKNKGKVAGPVSVQAIKDGKIVASQWVDGFEDSKEVHFDVADYDHIRIDHNKALPEINRQNNILKKKGLFKHTEPIAFKFGLSYNLPEKTEIFYLPTVGWNELDKWKFGLKLYNRILPESGWQYSINPQYSIGSDGLSGKVKLYHHWYSGTAFIQHAQIGIEGSQFSYTPDKSYQKITPTLNLTFKKSTKRSPVEHSLNSRFLHIQKVDENLQFLETKYSIKNSRRLHPYLLNLNLEKGADFTKTSVTLYNHWNINEKRAIDSRFFAGTFLQQTDNTAYQYHLSGIQAQNDYLFDYHFLNRAAVDGFKSRQLERGDGFMKFDDGESYQWMAALNVEVPLNKYFTAYADVAKISNNTFTGGGLKISLLSNRFNMYFPIYNSMDGILDWGGMKAYNFKVNLKLSLSDILPL
ncbi:MAG: M1 family metallopeptidase [Bacteroidetes bacterium]|nr:M1 family metallopeptidase [Bacteroidota bacterium]